MKTFLHVGCGPKRKDRTTAGFNSPDWVEQRLDIDPSVSPDIVGTMTDMSQVPSGSMDAVFSSHNLEHLYLHEVRKAVAEFSRVLKPDGFVVLTCPDLQSVCALVAQDKLLDSLYVSEAGPVAPLDILYGHRATLASGNLFMAHRSGFTQTTLRMTFENAGFAGTATMRRVHPHFDLFALACKGATDESSMRWLAAQHFPR